MIPENDRKEILRSLELLPNDRYKAEFYLHEVVDVEATQGEAFEAITNEAIEKTKQKQAIWQKKLEHAEKHGLPTEDILDALVRAEVMPNYSPENLKKHGAKTVYKKVPYVKVQRHGAKDFKSYKVTDAHKRQFPDEWAKFEAENEDYRNVRERRQDVQPSTSRPQNAPQGVSYNPPAYTINFG